MRRILVIIFLSFRIFIFPAFSFENDSYQKNSVQTQSIVFPNKASSIKSNFPLEDFFKLKPKEVFIRKISVSQTRDPEKVFFLAEAFASEGNAPCFFMNNLSNSKKFSKTDFTWLNGLHESDNVYLQHFLLIGNARNCSKTLFSPSKFNSFVNFPPLLFEFMSNYCSEMRKNHFPRSISEDLIFRINKARLMKKCSYSPPKYRRLVLPEYVLDNKVNELTLGGRSTAGVIQDLFEILEMKCLVFMASSKVGDFIAKKEYVGILIDHLLIKNQLETFIEGDYIIVLPKGMR